MTIRDLRSIEVDRAGLSDAVSRCRKVATSLGLPEGPVKAIGLNQASNEVEFTIGAGVDFKSTVLPSGALGALVLAYLIAVRVPVPKQATKSISVIEQGVKLTFEFLMNTPAPAPPKPFALPASAMDWKS